MPLAPTEEMLARRASRCRSCRRRGSSATRTSSGLPPSRQPAGRRARARRLLRAGRRAARTASSAKRVANWVTGELAAALREADEEGDPGRLEGRRPRARRAVDLVVAEEDLPRQRQDRCWRCWSPRAATRPRSSSARAWPDRRLRRARGDRRAAIEADPEAAEQIRAGNEQAVGADRRHRDEGDEGPRRRRRGQPPDQGEAGPLSFVSRRIRG